MRDRQGAKWFLSQIPSLLSQGLLAEPEAARLRRHYEARLAAAGPSPALVLFSILGCVLIGFGVILIFGRNWYEIPRPLRTFLAFLPLLLSQAAAFHMLAKDRFTPGLREGIAVLNGLFSAACLGLVGQIYQLPGDWGGFYLIWALMILPTFYLLQSAAAAALYLFAVTAWACCSQLEGANAVLYWPLYAAVLPFYFRTQAATARSGLGWAVACSAAVGAAVSLEKNLPGLWIVVYASLFTLMYFAERVFFNRGPARLMEQPLRTFGGAGICILLFMLSFHWPWKHVGFAYYRAWGKYDAWAGNADYVQFVIFFALAVTAFIRYLKNVEARPSLLPALFGFSPFLALGAYIAAQFSTGALFAEAFFNLYVLALSVAMMLEAAHQARLGLMNAGMLLFVMVVGARFFDWELGLLMRGVVFILLGLGFLYANLRILNARKAGAA